MLNVRLVTLDYYLSEPINELRKREDENVAMGWQEPVLRIFGPTPDGIKCCVHVHGVYPYMYVPFEGKEYSVRDALLFGAVLDEALKTTSGGTKFRFIHKVTPVTGLPLYGYHSKQKQFFKIYFCSPHHIKKASELLLCFQWDPHEPKIVNSFVGLQSLHLLESLQSGAVFGQKFQPHEAHIPYTLQFMIDYNIYGMSFVTFSKVKYRRNPDNPDALAGVKEENILSGKVKKTTRCYLEVDAWASDITNRCGEKAIGSNPGLWAIWEEEKVRRRALGRTSQVTLQKTEPRANTKIFTTEVMYKERLAKKLEDACLRGASEARGSADAYPAGMATGREVLEVSAFEEGIERPQSSEDLPDVSSLIDEEILTRITESQIDRAEDDGHEREEEETEADSILGRIQEAEPEDEEGEDMTQPLDVDEGTGRGPDANRDGPGVSIGEGEETFWRSMADRIFQLDGALESSSESDADIVSKGLDPAGEGVSEVCGSGDAIPLSPTWSGNIMSVLSDDSACLTPSSVCQVPHTFWCNYSPKMDSWLSHSQESWAWSKGGTGFLDSFSGKPDHVTFSAFSAETTNEASAKELNSAESYVDLFGPDKEQHFSSSEVTSLYGGGPLTEFPPTAILTPASDMDSSDFPVDSLCESTDRILKACSLSAEDKATGDDLVKEPRNFVSSEVRNEIQRTDDEKPIKMTGNFGGSKVSSTENNGRFTFCLTLKQYIKDCKEIVSVDFKNLCNREMVIIEYKSLNERSLQNKFLIKPLDKFLENWNAAERKANEQFSKNEGWPKVINGFGIRDSDGRENLRSVMSVFERKSRRSTKFKSVKNKFTVKSMKILRDDLSPTKGNRSRCYNINENVISHGKIKMRLIKSESGNPDGDSIEAAEGVPAAACKRRKTCSTFSSPSVCYNKRQKLMKLSGESDKLKETEKSEKRKERQSDECTRGCKKCSRKSSHKKSKKWRNFSEFDSKLIKEINSSFEEYFKNSVKLKNICGKKNKSFSPSCRSGGAEAGTEGESSEDEKDELATDPKKNLSERKSVKNVLSSSSEDPIKLVTRFLSTLSRVSQSRDLPPVSITISLGNTLGPTPVQVNVQPAVALSQGNASRTSRKQKRRAKIENVDGPDDSSEDDAEEPRSQSSKKKKKRKSAFYKPLNVVVHGSRASKSAGTKKKVSTRQSAKEEEVKPNTDSSSQISGDYFDVCRGNPGGSHGSCKPKGDSARVKSRNRNRGNKKNSIENANIPGETEDRELDIIYDSDQEKKFKKSESKCGNKWLKMTQKSVFKKIPQADTDGLTSSDDDDERRSRRNTSKLRPLIEAQERTEKEKEPPMKLNVCSGGPKEIGLENLSELSCLELPPVHLTDGMLLGQEMVGSFESTNPGLAARADGFVTNLLPLSGTPLFPLGKSPFHSGFSMPSQESQKLKRSEVKSDRGSRVKFIDGLNFDYKPKTEESGSSGGGDGVPALEWVLGLRILTPERKPLTRKEAVEFFICRELRGCVEEAAFYGDSRDFTKAMEAGPRSLKIESHSVTGLKPFKSSLEVFGTEERRNETLSLQTEQLGGKRFLFASHRKVTVTPLRKPPTPSRVLELWPIGGTDLGQAREPIEKSKVKVFNPLSPGQEGGSEEEMDLSVTLSGDVREQKAAGKEDSLEASPGLDVDEASGEGGETLRKGPLSKIKGIGRLKGLDPKSEMKAPDAGNSLNFLEAQASSTESKRSSDNSFQIRGVTLENTLGFSGSVENVQAIKLSHTHQHLSLMVMELHIQTRQDLRPDPDHDPVRALFYSIVFDSPARNQETGMVVVGEQLLVGAAAVSDHVVHSVPTEKALFEKTVSLVMGWDPDILAGYEIEMQSWGYLVQRGFVLEINFLALLGRVEADEASWKYASEVSGSEDDFYDVPKPVRQMKISGRIVLDVWRVLRHEVALTSYTFENVMYHLSHERHFLLSFKTLSAYWEHSSHRFRHITVDHYVTRVLGVIKLLDQLDFINRTSELSRLFGIQFYEVLSRGSQYRVESMMLRLSKPLNYVAVSPSVAQRAGMRAPASLPLILEPESFFFTDPLVVLDFQSLYPSIIIAYNYCFSTCLGRVEKLGGRQPFEFGCTCLQIPPEEVKSLEEEITISPAGVAFVKANIRKGILPAMLEEILETRLMVKKSLKGNRDNKVLQKVLFARQLGLKLIANVTYGYTAANFSGRMPCIEVGDSVVSKGRETLHRAIHLIKSTREWGARVVYGDTDSVFVLVPGRSREEAFRIGAEIADAVTQDNPKPVKLKLEKVYHPSILQTKKRYVGYMYETPDQEKPVLEAKGIETVRRDGCPAAAKILEKSLRILFDTRDVSLVKKYVIRQFAKLFKGSVNVQDMIFAKEYRGRRGYRPGACVPALHLARQWTQEDKRAEPRVKERVPYVIVNGPPGLPLIRLVRSPRELLADDSLRINAVYYITKAIIPPLHRCFSLLGADVSSWYSEVPRKHLKTHKFACGEGQKRSTISQYFATTECVVCSKVTTSRVCPECESQPQVLAVRCCERVRRFERCHAAVLKICQGCCGRTTELDCQSIDCPVLFRRKQASRDLGQGLAVRQILTQYI